MPVKLVPPWRRRVRVIAAGLLLVAVSIQAAADPEQVRRLLAVLHGIEQEYEEAFDDSGALVRPLELEEAGFLLAEARDRGQRLASDAPSDLGPQLAALTDAVEARAPVAAVAARVREIRGSLQDSTGVGDDLLPTELPSATRGEVLFKANCVSCHGERGAADGPDVPRLERRPPDFTDPLFMRAETPADFFFVISLGRRRSAMPAWGDALSVQERWDLVSHVWFLRNAVADIAVGQRLFVAHCAPCHAVGAAGPQPSGGSPHSAAAPLTGLERLAARSDADLYTAITEGIAKTSMPGFRTQLADEDRWKLVAFVRALSLGTAAPPSTAQATHVVAAAEETRLEPALARVGQDVAAAVDAYRLHEDDAAALAAGAYLVFEPLEPGINAHNPAAVHRVETEFVRLQKALRQPGDLKEVEAAAAAVHRALADARPAPGHHAGDTGPIWAAVVLLTAAILGLLRAATRRRRSGARGFT